MTTAVLQYGNNVRSPSLTKGTEYVMKTWLKEPTFKTVKFNGFETGGTMHDSPNKRIKDMDPTDLYHLTGDEGKFTASMSDNCIVLKDATRITFFETLANSTAVTSNTVQPPKPKAEKVAKTPKTPKAGKTETAKTAEQIAEEKRLQRNEARKLARKAARELAGKEVAVEGAPEPDAVEPVTIDDVVEAEQIADEALDTAIEAGVVAELAEDAAIEAEAEAEPITEEQVIEEPGDEQPVVEAEGSEQAEIVEEHNTLNENTHGL